MSRDELGDTVSTRQVPLLRPEGDKPYAVWRPEMETYMMRAGLETRDYKVAIPHWTEIVKLVEADAIDEEQAAIDALLTGTKREPDAKASGSMSSPSPPVVSNAHRKLAAAKVARAKKAYGLIYQSLAQDLRDLIGDIPQGYAFGLWSLLEERFQSKKDDNITEIWQRFIGFSQESGEPFDAYMARVEKVHALLDAAGQKPASGLRKTILLYRLLPMYDAARLALQASKQLGDEGKEIDWLAIKMFMQDHEREKLRADGPSAASEHAMATRAVGARPQRSYAAASGAVAGRAADSSAWKANIRCFNCNKAGHMSRECPAPRKDAGAPARTSNGSRPFAGRRGGAKAASSRRTGDSSDEDAGGVYSARVPEFGFAVHDVNPYASLDSADDSIDDLEEDPVDAPKSKDEDVVHGCPRRRSRGVRAATRTTRTEHGARVSACPRENDTSSRTAAVPTAPTAKPVDDDLRKLAHSPHSVGALGSVGRVHGEDHQSGLVWSDPARTILRHGDDDAAPTAISMETLAKFSHARTSGVHLGRCAERSVTMARMSSHVPARTILGRGRILPLTDRSHVRTQSYAQVASGNGTMPSSGNKPECSQPDDDCDRASAATIAPTTYDADSESDADSPSGQTKFAMAATKPVAAPATRTLTRLKRADGAPITRTTPVAAPKIDREANKKRVDAIRAENEEAAALKRETMQRNNPRGEAPIEIALRKTDFGVDTMASLHVTSNRSLLTNIRRCPPRHVKGINGAVTVVQWSGTVELYLKVLGEERNVKVRIDNVYWHEKFDVNLLSWGVLRKLKWKLNSSFEGTRVTTPDGTKLTAADVGRLTMLQNARQPEHVYSARLKMGRVACTTVNDLVRLHERLSHVGYDRLIEMCRAGRTDGVGSIDELSRDDLAAAKLQIQECSTCIQAKMARPSFGTRGLDSGRRPGEVLHIDTAHVTLPIDPATGRKRVAHWVIAGDSNSEARFNAIVDTKDEVSDTVIGIVRRVQLMSDKRVKTIYCDNGSEFINKKLRAFCHENGTNLNTPPANTPELRGVAERNVRSFKDCTRAMMIHAGADMKVWRYAANFQAYLWNRTRIAKATKMTPLEALGGRTPSVLHAGVFGCDAWVHQRKSQRDLTFDAKAQPAVYLGHNDEQHGALVLLLHTGKVTRTRDVELREKSFVFMKAIQSPERMTRAAATAYRPSRVRDDFDLPSTSERRVNDPSATARGAHSSRQGGRSSMKTNAAVDDSGADASSNSDVAPPADVVSSDDDPDQGWDVEKVIGRRLNNKKLEYEVKWAGFDKPTWEPKKNFENAREAIEAFEQQRREQRRANAPKATPAEPRFLRSKAAHTDAPASDSSQSECEDDNAVCSIIETISKLNGRSRV